jgi:hypothetical protein
VSLPPASLRALTRTQRPASHTKAYVHRAPEIDLVLKQRSGPRRLFFLINFRHHDFPKITTTLILLQLYVDKFLTEHISREILRPGAVARKRMAVPGACPDFVFPPNQPHSSGRALRI